MALPLLVHVRRLPAGGSTTDAAQGHMEVRTLQIVSGAGGEHPFTLTLALRADGLLVARCCDGRRRLGNRTPHALAQPLPAATELKAELEELVWHSGHWELRLRGREPAAPPLCKIDLEVLAEAPASGAASAVAGVPGGVGGDIIAHLCRRRDELRDALAAGQQQEAELAARRDAREGKLREAVDEVQRAEVDACLAFLPVLETKRARLAELEREAVDRGCPVPQPSDDDDSDEIHDEIEADATA